MNLGQGLAYLGVSCDGRWGDQPEPACRFRRRGEQRPAQRGEEERKPTGDQKPEEIAWTVTKMNGAPPCVALVRCDSMPLKRRRSAKRTKYAIAA
jgi:hypothetical protein